MSDFKPRPGQFTGRHMLLIMIAFFGVIISVNVLMAVVAVRSWTGLVVKNSYVASQNFNTSLAAARQQAERGWQARLALGSRQADVTFIDTTTGQLPLSDLTVSLLLSRPTYEADDQVISLRETEPGHYQAPVSLDPGVWNAELKAISSSGESFRQIHRVILKATEGS